jgi:hypothetical protein
MIMNKYKSGLILVFSLCLAFVIACHQEKNVEGNAQKNTTFSIADFYPIGNLNKPDSVLFLDYTNAYTEGFVIPSIRQTANGLFTFSFKIKNTSGSPSRFAYKIYYQNESYKVPELDSLTGKMSEFAHENFYGSWEDSTVSFRMSDVIPSDDSFHAVQDSFRIVGNPRNEYRYRENGVNQRWKRNPRVGNYSFLLVVIDESVYKKNAIPDFIGFIGKANNGQFVNPYYYFIYGEGSKISNLISTRSPSVLKVAARPDAKNGIYINDYNFDANRFGQYFTASCGQDSNVYKNAAFEQFINNQDPSMRFDNIPVVRDVMADDYSYTDYNWDMAFYKKEETISTLPAVSSKPCENVLVDQTTGKLTLINPGCKEGQWKKQSVGIRTRHGFTYGKYRLKCKLTELLNKNNVWNGLTNAIWLLNQQHGGAWNYRRACRKEGYMATYWGGDNDKRTELIDYSEIDFEILKTPPYCPSEIFPPVIQIPSPDKNNKKAWNVPFSEDLKGSEPMITVACTNWDMACWEPENFASGCNDIVYNDKKFSSHRWTKNYRALTQKQYEPDDELFAGDFYYFEIDWRPDEIIWRIGPTPENMRVVGYMNNKITMIPNNQMTLIVTQEYHNTKWWPGSPFIQENIPFPSKDLIGEIYELVIE